MARRKLNKIGDKIYDLRRIKEISQDDFAKRVGVSRQTVIKWEGNIVKPKADKLQLICDALGVGIDSLISREAAEKPSNNNADVATGEAVCDEVGKSSEEETMSKARQDASIKERDLSVKSKIVISAIVISIVMLLGLIMILIDAFKPRHEGSFNQTVDVIIWDVSLVDLGWILFSVSIATAVIMGLILICKYVNKLKNNKKKVTDVES